MNKYIDMHCHILPGVDDGASDIDEAKKMLKIAYDDGIRCIIATPHYHPSHGSCSPNVLKKKACLIRHVAHEIDKNFHIFLGCEIYFQQNIPELIQNSQILTMNNRRYILIEFSPDDSYFYIRQGLQRLQNNGYEVILAHTERYNSIVNNFRFAEELYDMGIHLQVNSGSILGKYGTLCKKFIKYLLKKDMIFCVGTDAHNAKNRVPNMHKASLYVTKHYGEQISRRIFFSNAFQMLKKIKTYEGKSSY